MSVCKNVNAIKVQCVTVLEQPSLTSAHAQTSTEVYTQEAQPAGGREDGCRGWL